MRPTKTVNNLVGRVVRYVEHGGDYILRSDYEQYNGEDDAPVTQIPIGSVGIIVALHYHGGVSSCGPNKQDKDEDRWVEVDFGDDREYFWREELELVYPSVGDSVIFAQMEDISDWDKISHPPIVSIDERGQRTSAIIAPMMSAEPASSNATPKFRYATLLNDDGHTDGFFHSPIGLTQHQWEGLAEDLECAWGVYYNDCNVCLPVEEIGLPNDEEREYSGGWWEARTLESINAFRLGVPAFFCYIAKANDESIQPLGHLPAGSQSSSIEIHWI